ncbi:MAG: ABC transporter permease [Gemmatimonadota bacterium]
METLRVAFGEILANKLRAALTMLGIIIGVAAVITMVALGSGAQRAVEDQLNALGTDLISVRPERSRDHGVSRSERARLLPEDAEALRASGLFRTVVPEMEGNRQIEFMGRNENVDVVATTPAYAEANNYEVVAGRRFTAADNQGRKRVAVLGAAVPEEFESNAVAMIGEELVIGGVGFEIIGLLSEKGAQGWWNPDEQVLIPLKTGQYRTFGSDRLRSITVQIADPDSMELAMLDIETILRRQHGIRPGDPNDFDLRNQSQFLTAQQETTKTFTSLLAGIAAVSLIVGGIGIMNIMLVSVTERTREIGVRKAMGATRRTILTQFLVEAVTVCAVGGAIGILAGTASAIALGRAQGWNTQVSIQAVAMAVGFAAVVGIFFGLWPARRAARLDPIEALRYE